MNDPERLSLVPLPAPRAVAYIGGPAGDERARPVIALIEETVARLGERDAYIADEGTWTLAEAWAQAEAHAARLHAAMKGEPKPVVAIAEKGLAQVATLLACFRLGVPYIPINPGDDTLRSRHIMALAQPFILVRDARDRRRWEAMGPTAGVVVFDAAAAPGPRGPLPPPPAPTAPVMVIFTSGSTGVPKGVALSQAEILDATWRRMDYWKLDPDDRAIYHGALSIIGMAINALAVVLGGGSMVVTREGPTVGELVAALIEHDGTLIAGYIGFLRLLTQHPDARRAFARLKSLTIYGDRMEWRDVADMRAVLPETALLTYDYGLSEMCFVAGGYVGPTEAAGTVAMGIPHPGIELWWEGEPERDADGALVGLLAVTLPEGQAGYWRSDQDAWRFVPHPRDPRLRVFLTGDIVRLQADGVFRFLGRSDNQVKLNGRRIELEEIEAVAREAPGIGAAGVVPRRDAEGRVERLVLHVAPRGDARPEVKAVADHIGRALPLHMRPAVIVLSPALPLTATAKVDRLRLAEFDRQVQDRRAASKAPAAGGWPDGLSRRIAGAIAAELRQPPARVTAGATFAELEGDSLLALAAALHIEKVFGVTLDPALLLTDEPLGEIVAGIARQVRERAPAG